MEQPYGDVKKARADLPRLLKEASGVRSDSDAWLMALAADKIEGLDADLESAVEVAFKRGATDWTRLNYPAQYKRLMAQR
jgi:hypothetical protein